MPNDRSTPTTRVLAGNRNPAANRGLAPAASFSDVLKDLSVNDEGEMAPKHASELLSHSKKFHHRGGYLGEANTSEIQWNQTVYQWALFFGLRYHGLQNPPEFQSIDITESSRTVETSELHLFGVTKVSEQLYMKIQS